MNKQYKEALECFDDVLLKDPENPDALQFKNMTNQMMNEED
jgi:hypothetical protein